MTIPPGTEPSPAAPARRFSVLCYGAGAIGTYIGGSLALHGHRVVFLEQPAVASALREGGLRLNLLGEERTVPNVTVAAALESALAEGPYDFAVFALKSFDTRAVLESIAPFATDFPPVLCLQNGVENEAAIAEALGAARVIPGTVTSAIGRRGPGSIVLERLRGIGVAGDHPLAPGLVAALSAAGLQAQWFSNPAAMKWSKLMTNLMANASSAILDLPPAEIFAHPGLYRLEISQLREILAVMAVLGIRPVDLPGTPVRLLAFAVRWLPARLSRPLLARAIGQGRGAKMPSFHIDLHSGRGRSEVDYLNGAVVRFGEAKGIPTPVNRFYNETLLDLTAGRTPLDAYAHKPAVFLQKFRELNPPPSPPDEPVE